eukprot:CAMPEP_0119332130 /NCGR_PEP_ID=MMETSP1333-20130426/82100_1 /TAXON_ID=418940 /ORGANISM="Scyphosphaera apsteinii, Strain RCC1455" /LENGTH=40 /DNA_ID= /DNA_START= /DNA_END= /DNA_ORIENTATION=
MALPLLGDSTSPQWRIMTSPEQIECLALSKITHGDGVARV